MSQNPHENIHELVCYIYHKRGLVNVQIEHHPTMGIFKIQRTLWGCDVQNPKNRTFTNPRYPLVNKHSYWKWPSRNSGFTHKNRMVDLSSSLFKPVYQRVSVIAGAGCFHMTKIRPNHLWQPGKCKLHCCCFKVPYVCWLKLHCCWLPSGKRSQFAKFGKSTK